MNLTLEEYKVAVILLASSAEMYQMPASVNGYFVIRTETHRTLSTRRLTELAAWKEAYELLYE